MSVADISPRSPACYGCGIGCSADPADNSERAPITARALIQVVLVLFGIPLAVLVVTIWSVPEAMPIGVRAIVILLVLGLTLGVTSRAGDRLVNLVSASPHIR